MAKPAQGVGMATIFLAVMLVVKLSPNTTGQTLFSKQMESVAQVFVASPTLMNVPVLTLFS